MRRRGRGGTAGRAWGTVLLVGLLLTTGAGAHDADLLAARLWRPVPDGPEVRERITLTADTLARLLPPTADGRGGGGTLTQVELDARGADLEAGVWDAVPLSAGDVPCTRTARDARVREGYVELTASFSCPPGPLRQRFSLLAALPPGYHVVLNGTVAGATRPLLAVDPDPTADGQGAAGEERGFGGWVGLGIAHILGGPDHLAFLLAVLLVGGGARRVLGVVTAFTVAHSLTLGAAALGWLWMDAARTRWVEATIAASILFVAVENLARRAPRHRVAVTFAFGLVHGLGFASALGGYGLGEAPGGVVGGLFGFNLGVELGQAAVVAVLWPLLRMLQRRPALHRRTVCFLSFPLAILALCWFTNRAFASVG